MLRNKKEKYGKFGSPEHIKNLCDELADCQLTLIATFGYLGLDVKQVNKMILEKLLVFLKNQKKQKNRIDHLDLVFNLVENFHRCNTKHKFQNIQGDKN